ncbi:VC_2705 family sodium/solute symporter [Aquincola sp. MAHUQ-54]|uniref:VC_2705 family sodium/solute symporter n=1 Tax=Aquincola agrisoli TaxID=3119538 RepID=A0AAW9QLY1_9BURK
MLVFVALLAVAERSGFSRAWIGTLFLVATVAVYATIGLSCRTTDEAEYYVAGRRVPAFYNGMATAADWISAASFLGMAGVLYLQGFGGLAYLLGWTGGFCLVALLLAPYLRRFGQFTIPDFIGERYGGVPRIVAVMAVLLVSFVYVVVQIYGVGLITSHLTGFSFEVGIFVGLGGVLVCSFLGGMRAVTWTQVAQYIVLLIAFLLPLVWLSVKQSGNFLPQLTYDEQLQQVTRMEEHLRNDAAEQRAQAALERRAIAAQQKLADVPAAMAEDARVQAERIQALKAEDAPLRRIQQAERQLALAPSTEDEARTAYERDRDQSTQQARPLGGMAPQAEPFAAGAPGEALDRNARRNFLALVFCLMVGTAAMPHVLTRYYTTPSVAQARNSVGWSLLFIMLLYVSVPALAVLVKYEVLSSLIGTPFDQLPAWIRRWSKLDSGLVRVEDINADGVLQLAELRLSSDIIVLAAPEIGGLPYVVTCLLAAGGLAAALSTADGLLLTVANALSHDLYYRSINRRASAIRRVMMSKMLVLVVALLAAWVASLRIANILQFVSAAFSLAASAFFPALVLGIFWRRATRWGATLGMLSGLAVCMGYMAANLPALRGLLGWAEPAADFRWWGIDPVAAGVFGVPVGFAVMWLASRFGPAPEPAQAALVDRLRSPLAD